MKIEEISAVELANERMSIFTACNKLGMDIPDYASVSMKLYCPFGHLFHADGGMSKAFRIYPGTNSAYCFASCGYFTPVRLIAMDKDVSNDEAAEMILLETNYVPPDYTSRWAALTEETTQIDKDALANALKLACERIDPAWEIRQFEEPIAETFQKCLSLLTKVRTEEETSKWLAVTTEVMRKKIGEYRE